MTSRTRFIKSWLTESPEGISPTDSYGINQFNIRDLINSGAQVQDTSDSRVKKIELTNTVYYWVQDNGVIQLTVELTKNTDNLTVNSTGKDLELARQSPWADELYLAILEDSGKPVLFSDDKLTPASKKIWQRLVSSGRTVTVYDRDAPGVSRVTLSRPEQVEQFWRMNDPRYRRWRFVLSECGMMTLDIIAAFNTRRMRELTGMGTEDYHPQYSDRQSDK